MEGGNSPTPRSSSSTACEAERTRRNGCREVTSHQGEEEESLEPQKKQKNSRGLTGERATSPS